MKSFFSWSIRAHLLLLVFLAVIPALGIILYSGIERYDDALKDTQLTCTYYVNSLAAKQESIVSSIHVLLTTLADMKVVQMRQPVRCNALFGELLEQNPQLNSLQGADTLGNIFASGLKHPALISMAERKYFKDVIKTRAFSAGEYVVSRTTKRPMLNFAYPVFDSIKNLQAVIQAGIALDRYDSIFNSSARPNGAILVLTDYKGTILHFSWDTVGHEGKPDKEEDFKIMTANKEEGSFFTKARDGSNRLIVFKRLRLKENDPPYIYIRTSIPESTVLSDAKFLLSRNLVLLGIAAFLAGLAAWFFGNLMIVSRLKRTVLASKKLAQGDLSARVNLKYPVGELGELSNTFNEMAISLETREKQRKIAEDERDFIRLYLKNIFDSMPSVLIGVDPDGFVAHWNLEAEKWTNISFEKAKGKLITEIFPEISIKMEKLKKALVERLPQIEEKLEIVSSEGTKYAEIMIYPLVANGINGAVIRVDDITERIHIEEMMIQSEKMSAIGQLASGVAHDFNNVLTVISGNAQMLLLQKNRFPFLEKHIEPIIISVERAKSITGQLLTFSRKESSNTQVLDLNHTVNEMKKMIGRFIGENIHVIEKLIESPCMISADNTQIEQIIMNLVLNARDALNDGGTITIKTEKVIFTQSVILNEVQIPPHAYIKLSISDDGCGINKKNLPRIFDPFFTTKEIGKGTGLGLSIVYNAVIGNNGYIFVESEAGVGTIFTIYFPESDEEFSQKESIRLELPKGNQELILIVEDDEGVHELLKSFLPEIGYRTVTAVNGIEALKILHKEKVDLILTDLVMPKMGGVELAKIVRSEFPEMIIVGMTGYISENRINLEKIGFRIIIEKPIEVKKIAEVLASIFNN